MNDEFGHYSGMLFCLAADEIADISFAAAFEKLQLFLQKLLEGFITRKEEIRALVLDFLAGLPADIERSIPQQFPIAKPLPGGQSYSELFCSPGFGAEPQQAENTHIRRGGNERFSHMARHRHCLRLLHQIWYNSCE